MYDGILRIFIEALSIMQELVTTTKTIIDLTQEISLTILRLVSPTSTLRSPKPQWQMELPDSLSSQEQAFNLLQKRKLDILHIGNGLCSFPKIGS
jgi:hypothetical protein